MDLEEKEPSASTPRVHILNQRILRGVRTEEDWYKGKRARETRTPPVDQLEAILVLRSGISQGAGRSTYVVVDLGAISTRTGSVMAAKGGGDGRQKSLEYRGGWKIGASGKLFFRPTLA
jgi:hypothetical protein